MSTHLAKAFVLLLILLSTLNVGAQNIKDVPASQEQEEQTSYLSDHVTVYPAEDPGARDVSCSCWVEPDETYTEVTGLANMDDGSTNNLALPFNFDLFGETYSSFWLNINGHITFDDIPSGFYVDADFPDNRVMLTPCFGDIDLSCATCGELYYKITTDAVYINWVNVGHFNATSDQVQNFQMIFTSNSSDLLGDGNNVQFCYEDMQWVFTNSSQQIELGAAGGNGVDNIQFGLFDQENTAVYDGPFGNGDGIDWLDNKTISFNSSLTSTQNTPPISVGASECDTIRLCQGDTETIEFSFLAPENNQEVNITVDDGGFTNLTSDVIVGSYTNSTITVSSDGVDPGFYEILVTATDDGSPAASTVVGITIEVISEAIPDLDIYHEGEIVSSVSYCQGQEEPFLSGTDGFDCYLWSNGSHEQTDQFNQGTYDLTAFWMGCEAEAGPVTVFQIPVFNPDVIIDDQFLCAGESTDIILDEPELYDEFEWSIFNMNGEILSGDLMNDSIVVTPGTYEISVIDENGCPGSRIVEIIEEIVVVPNTNFAPECDNNQVCWSGAWSDPEVCAHFIYLTDSDGDTWEGANVEVYVDGTGPFNFNISTGATFQPDGITPYHGQVIEYYFTPGIDDDDIGVQIFDGDNTIIFDSNNPGDELIEGLFFTQVADCGFSSLPGVWSAPDCPDGVFDVDDEFNPANGSNCFTVPEGFIGECMVVFESGVCSESISFTLDFLTSPTVTTTDYSECDEAEVQPTYGPQEVSDTFEYNWTPNLDCDGNPNCVFNSSANYQIQVSNDCGTATAQGNVTINESPTAALSDFTLCDAESQILNPGNSADDVTYSWTGPGVTGNSTETVTVTQPGTYVVDVTNDCGTISAASNISVFSSPSVPFWAFDTLVCAGEVIDIDPSWSGVDGPISWSMSWTDGDGNEQTMPFSETGEVLMFGSDQIPLDAENTNAHIQYSYSNLCGTASGQVTAYTDACFITATNVISPDNDGADNGQFNGGLNEGWYIVGIESVTNVEVKIYNRWGTLVYENDNYSNSDPWKGKGTADNDLSEGVYYYTIKTPRGNQEIQGSVTILRNN